MFREIFVPLLGSSSDDAALDAAMAIAVAHGAHVTAMVTLEHPMPLVTEFGYVPVELDQRLLEESRAAASNRAGQARARLAQEAVSSEVRVTEAMALWSEETAAMQALHCDISIVGRPGPGQFDGSPRFDLTFRSLLLRSGRPVIVMPPDCALPMPVRRVVLAWKPTPEAARALHDSLPLLTSAAEIDVLVIDPEVTEGGYARQPAPTSDTCWRAMASRSMSWRGRRRALALAIASCARSGRPTRTCWSWAATAIATGANWSWAASLRTVVDGSTKAVLFSH
jgi:nucleotide-binding universal stress UspA family protein